MQRAPLIIVGVVLLALAAVVGLGRLRATSESAPAVASSWAPTSACETLCNHDGYGKCAGDPKAHACVERCEKGRDTSDGKCRSQVDALYGCVAAQPAANLHCGPSGTSEARPGTCDAEKAAVSACVRP
jgi:hypothetical protein